MYFCLVLVGKDSAGSVQALCIWAVDKHLECVAFIAQVQINLLCVNQGWQFPNTSCLLCVHDRASLCMHMHHHLVVQIWQHYWSYCPCHDQARCAKSLTQLMAKRTLKNSGYSFFHPRITLPFCTSCLFLPSRSKLPSWVLRPPLQDSSDP